MKAYTDLEQSKKLARILPIDSADMRFPYFGDGQYGTTAVFGEPLEFSGGKDIPAWSLAALLEQFEDTAGLAKDYGLWFCYDNRKSSCTKHYDNPVDACVEMIVKLKERNLLQC